jgi:hypothetical protein
MSIRPSAPSHPSKLQNSGGQAATNLLNLLCSPRPLNLTEDEPAAPITAAVFGLVFSALSLRSASPR